MAFWHSLAVTGTWLLSESSESLWQKCSPHSRRSLKAALLPTPLQTRRPMAAPGTVMPLTQRAYQQWDNDYSSPLRAHSEKRLYACGSFLFVCEQNLNIISNFFPLYAYTSLFVLHTLGKKKSLAGWLTPELLFSSTYSVRMCMHVHTQTCVIMPYVGLYHLGHLPSPINLVLTQALFLLQQFSTWVSVLFESTKTTKTKSLSCRHCNSIQFVRVPRCSAWHFLHFGSQASVSENVWDVGSSSINGHIDQFLPT